MPFELEADGIHFYCSSPALTRKLIERGARLLDQSKAEDLRRAVEPEPSHAEPGEEQALPPPDRRSPFEA